MLFSIWCYRLKRIGSTCPWPRESCYPYENKAGDCKVGGKACIDSEEPKISVSLLYFSFR